jgi:hypothetical protein
MRKTNLLVALALVASLACLSPASAAPPSSSGGTSGDISLTVHAHSSQFTATLFPTSPLPFPVTEESTGTYSSIPCSRPAPFNDTALDFTPDFPGVEDPASVRHFVEVALSPTKANQGTVEGEITTILCLNGQETENRIFLSFEGTYKQADGKLKIQGTFEITGGTGIFADMTGEGTISGTITCFNVSCADRGVYSDLSFALQGTFSDPTT